MWRSDAGPTIRTLTVAVATAAVALASVRAGYAQIATIAIVVACMCYLTCRSYTEVASRMRANGLTTGPGQRAGMFLASASTTVLLIGLQDLAFLGGYYGSLKLADAIFIMSHWSAYKSPMSLATGGLIGLILALWVTSSLVRTVCMSQRTESMSPVRWFNLWPVGLVMLIGVALVVREMRERYTFCRMMAAYHAGPQMKADGVEKAKLHTWLARWYERAAIRPWLPIHPSRIPPGLE